MDQISTPANAARTRRKNTTKACEECRRRRSKCNGERPTCARCTNHGIRCLYAAKEDGRQPAPKSYVLLLRRRIQVLEDALKIHGIDVQTAVTRSASSTQSRNRLRMSQLAALQHDDDNSVDQNLSSALEGAFISDESLSFGADGEPRYFGSVSGRPELSRINESTTSPSSVGTDNARSPANRSNLIPENPGLEVERLISIELKQHLIDLYFTWQHPWFCVIDERLFRDSERHGGRYCSPLLLNSILAMGSRYSERTELRSKLDEPQSTGKIFLERAETLLQVDLKWPSITTIQSLCILSTVVIAHGSDATGWLYQGMAKSLALDMGLNVDCGDLVRSGALTGEEVNLRRLIYWSLYCDDKLSALYTGRVCTMLDSQANVELPGSRPDFENAIDRSNVPLDDITSRYSESYAPYIKAFVGLNRILETIFTTLYTPKTSSTGEISTSFLESCLLDLKNWSYDLSPEVKVDRIRAGTKQPHVFILHMVYHTTYIVVAKFFSTRRGTRDLRAQRNLASEREPGFATHDYAEKICYDAAREICALAVKYRQTFGSFRQSPITATHCTLSAALVLLRRLAADAKMGSSTHLSDQASLDVCLTVLSELSSSWHPARRLRLHITNLFESSNEQHLTLAQQYRSSSVTQTNLSGESEHLHDDSLLDPLNEIRQRDIQSTTDHFAEFETLVAGWNHDQSVMEFNFNSLDPHGNDLEGMLHNSSLPVDYLNFDLSNNWFFPDDVEETI